MGETKSKEQRIEERFEQKKAEVHDEVQGCLLSCVIVILVILGLFAIGKFFGVLVALIITCIGIMAIIVTCVYKEMIDGARREAENEINQEENDEFWNTVRKNR